MPTKTTLKKAAVKSVRVGKTAVAKKTVKKAVAKKSVSKKVASKPKEFKALVCAIDGECFWTRDGRILQNLSDLHMAFGSMDDEIFLHHANKEKNDFADWVEYVLQDLECAEELRRTTNKANAEKILLKHLNRYGV